MAREPEYAGKLGKLAQKIVREVLGSTQRCSAVIRDTGRALRPSRSVLGGGGGPLFPFLVRLNQLVVHHGDRVLDRLLRVLLDLRQQLLI